MTQILQRLKIDYKYLPLIATITLFILAYAYGFSQYRAMRTPKPVIKIHWSLAGDQSPCAHNASRFGVCCIQVIKDL